MRAIAIHFLLYASAVLFLADAATSQGPTREVSVPMPDGVGLATTVHLPDELPAPVVLVRTPYGRSNMAFVAEGLTQHGYAVALQDVRGKYDSGGRHRPFVDERGDGVATVQWLARQPWNNGDVGLWGLSYSAYAGLVLADQDLPELESVFAVSGWVHPSDMVGSGGATRLLLGLTWMLTQQGRVQQSMDAFQLETLWSHLPLSEAMRAAGVEGSLWEDKDWAASVSQATPVGAARTPVLHVAGWYDMVRGGTLDAWQRLAPSSPAPQRLIIGPWSHNQMLTDSWEVGDRDFGPASAFGTADLVELARSWFDATLMDKDQAALQSPTVRYFVMASNSWQEADEWPPKTSQTATFWTSSPDGPAHLLNHGELTGARPEAATDRFRSDPNDPVPTLGGDVFFYFPDLVGVRDQRAIEERPDVLSFTSAPMEEALHVAGPVRVRLRASIEAPDTDVAAKLVRVEPDGYAVPLTDGLLRLSSAGVRPEPGKAFQAVVELGHVAATIPRGHRIRLDLAGTNFPKFDRNPNTGADPFEADTLRPIEVNVHHGPDGTRLDLPVVELPLGSDRPIVEDASPADAPHAVTISEIVREGESTLEAARRALDEGAVDRAIALAERAITEDSVDPEHHLFHGQALLAHLQEATMFKKLSLSKKVRAAYARALELAPDHVETHVALTRFYLNAPAVAGGGLDKAEVQIGRLMPFAAKRAELLRAELAWARKRPGDAIDALGTAYAIDPDDAEVALRLALRLQQQERWDDAFEHLETSQRRTGSLDLLYQLGRTSALSGKRLEAGISALERYLDTYEEAPARPEPAAAHWRIGILELQKNRIEKAKQRFEKALALAPGFEQAAQSLRQLEQMRKPDSADQ